MKGLKGKVAVVTGGGSGIGAAIGKVLAAEGMKIVLADVQLDAAQSTAEKLNSANSPVFAFHTDVTKKDSIEALAKWVRERFGCCHLLCANAGVLQIGRLETATEEDWEWVLSVNLMGVVRTVKAFLPQMKQQPGEKHIVITTSMAGLLAAGPAKGVYNTSKHAVMAFGETLRVELADDNIGVSLLLPAGTMTRVMESGRNRPAELGPWKFTEEDMAMLRRGIGESAERAVMPEYAVRNLVRGINNNEPWIITHDTQRPLIEKRFQAILAAFDHSKT